MESEKTKRKDGFIKEDLPLKGFVFPLFIKKVTLGILGQGGE